MFDTVLTYQNQRSFVCSIDDFGQIETITKSRTKIRDQVKHEKYNETMMSYVKKILTNRQEEEIVVATRDTNTGDLLCYTIVLFPAGSGFYFIMTAETAYNENILNYDDSGLALTHKLVAEISLKKKAFNGFSCMKLNSILPAMMMYIKSKVIDENRTDMRIHSVIHPNRINLTRIEKTFMESGFGLYDRSNTSFGIVHMSTLPNYRLEHL